MTTSSTLILQKTFANKLEPDTLDRLRGVAQRRTYPAGTILCHEGALEHTFYIIVEGKVAASKQREEGDKQLVGMMGPLEYFGELALLDNAPRAATCTTLAETTVLEVTEDAFDQIVERSPALAYSITRGVLATLRQSDRQAIADLQAKNEALRQAYTRLQAAQMALVEKERLEHELELAADVQRTLLPAALPQLAGYELTAYLQPARLVGGDLYDVVALDADHVGLLIADVSDKGLHASLFMAVTKTLFHIESKRSTDPAQVLLAMHRGLLSVAATNDLFVTAFYGVLHCPSGRLTYARAGHERPLLIRPSQSITALPGNGRFLGMLDDLTLEAQEVQLWPGDRLLLFSDGVPDATNQQDEKYGNGRFWTLLQAHAAAPIPVLVQQLVADITHWQQNVPSFDDLTLLALAVQ